ncbi:MAG TPA: hypothetical protein VHW65_05160, partial [Gemmatimonadales bacterium]|nr:hypothetical protein [Gemmatimonadales bacterium]
MAAIVTNAAHFGCRARHVIVLAMGLGTLGYSTLTAQNAPLDRYGNFVQIDYRVHAPDRVRNICHARSTESYTALLKADDSL